MSEEKKEVKEEETKENKPETKPEEPKKEEIKEEVEQPKVSKIPEIRPGYTVRVHQKIKDGKKERIQVFEGMVLKMKGDSPETRTITVHKVSQGVGVDKIFPLALPTIEKIEVVKIAKVRQANLEYLKEYNKKLKEERIVE